MVHNLDLNPQGDNSQYDCAQDARGRYEDGNDGYGRGNDYQQY